MFENRHFSSSSLQDLIQDSNASGDRKGISPFVSLFCIACGAVITTVAMSLTLHDVWSFGNPFIMIGHAMKWFALLLVYLIVLHLLAVKYPNSFISISLLKDNFHIPPRVMLHYLTVIGICGGSLAFAVKSITTCRDNDLDNMYEDCCCNEFKDLNHLPPGLCTNISMLLFIQIVMCLDTYWVIVPCWIAISSSLFIPIILNSNPFLCDEVFYLILFAAASILYVKQSKEIFLQNLQLVKTENQAVSLQSNAMMLETRMNDMRLLLGNIAHDLKTPMQAFAMELSSLDEAIVSMRGGYVTVHSCDSGDIADKGRRSVEIENCTTSVVTLHDICSFMNATINRCLDYGKATVGLALFPLIEPVHLEESMNWVVNCINRTQEGNVSVVLAELLPAMCSHINTDKKWLEENLLCLVSNAVKFQMHGLVHVRCLLIESDDPGRASGYSHKSSGGPEWASDDVSSYSNDVGALTSQLFLKFEVEDGGIGISAEKKDMLFNPYVDDRNVVGGTGLGLFSLSKRVEALGGECGVDAKQNGEQGCCFWFTIPYLPAESIPARSRASSSASSFMSQLKLSPLSEVKPMSPRHNKYIKSNRIHIEGMMSVDDDDDCVHYDEEQGMILHEKSASKTSLPLPKKLAEILLVEDSIIIQKTTKRTFEAWGYEVNIAANGLLGLNEIMKKKYDLVLMDLQMPVMDGMDATRKIREHEAEKQTPESDRQLIIGISANCDDATRDLALACGMNDFVPKPFSIEDLKRVLVLNKVPVN